MKLRGQKFVERFRRKLRICNLHYEVFRFSAKAPPGTLTPETSAAINPHTQKLFMRDEQGSGIQIAESVLHEIAHGIMYSVLPPGLSKDQDESVATAIGYGFAQTFHDNPWLLDWLKAATKDA